MTSTLVRPNASALLRSLGALRLLGVATCVVTAVGISVQRFGVTDPELSSFGARLLQAYAAGCALALAPAALAAMSAFRRSLLLAPAAMVSWPLGGMGIMFFPVLIPLGVAAYLFVFALPIRYDGAPCGALRSIAAIVIVPLLLLQAVLVLFFLDDVWTHPAVSVRESLFSLSLVQAAVVAAWFLTVPDDAGAGLA